MIITYSDGTITGTTPEGETAWTYTRANELCALNQAWGKVVAAYRDNAGCGDVVAINARTGKYANTRSAIAPDEVTGIHSNDRVGTVGASRIELWRSDMVRTVEYGKVEAPQEPDMQPNQCQITSALTRTELLANTEVCDDGAYLRFQNVTPEDSRKPEMYGSVAIAEDAYLVAISQDAAAIYDPVSSEIRAYNKDGNSISTSSVPGLPAPDALGTGAHPLSVADLPTT
ncbi:Rv3212 family protein [Corynebacterium aquatimens]|uniref:Rv3212 family protein n=1 Tax=Corynebacterium aquatimens TaxID=1190508 RepID=UPI0033135F54